MFNSNEKWIDDITEEVLPDSLDIPENELNQRLYEKLKKEYSEKILPDILSESGKTEYKDEIYFEISQNVNVVINEPYYIPESKKMVVKYERLASTAFIGSILFGIIFYFLLGGIFTDKYYAALLGMPIGSAFLVWLFTKAAKHPKIASVIKWGSIVGFAGITIASIFSNLKGGFFGKKSINFFQWLFMGLTTLCVFWMIHIFKPEKITDISEVKKSIGIQLKQRIMTLCVLTEAHLSKGLDKNYKDEKISEENTQTIPVSCDEKMDKSLYSGKFLPAVFSKMLNSSRKNDEKLALVSINSYINALKASGIEPVEKARNFTFDENDEKYYDTFGIISSGDEVEILSDAWKAPDGKPLIKGMVRKVRK